MVSTYKAEYRCDRCQHRFDVMQGPGAAPSAKKCQHKWIEWLNYDALQKSRFSQIVP